MYYASTSRRLIHDVMHLLLRMGVQGRITRTVLHDLATNAVYWDKIVGVVSLGSRQANSLSAAEGHPVLTGGAVMRLVTKV